MCEIFKNEKWPNLILIFPAPTCNFPRMLVVVKNSNLAEKKITFCKRKQITQYEDSQARGYRKRCAAPTWLRFFKSKLIFGSNLEVWDQKKHMPALKNFSKFSVEILKKKFFFKTLIFDFWQLIFGIYAWN